NHPDVAMTLNNMAVLFKSQKKYDEAERLYQRSLSIFERALGPTHPRVATCLKNYAKLLRKNKRIAEAVKLENRAKLYRTAP
ncbi:MAG: tetratricopeptide repeat protein, partial [Pyrinomonadaceae bacterium]